MNKTLVLLILSLLFAGNGFSQSVLSKIEFEAGAASNLTALYKGYNFGEALSFHIHARYNLQTLPIDIGIHISARYWDKGNCTESRSVLLHSNDFLATGNYYFLKSKKISPFAGLGLGLSRQVGTNEFKFDGREEVKRRCALFMSPHIGLEFFNLVRLSANYNLTKKEFRCFEVNLGFLIGKGRKH